MMEFSSYPRVLSELLGSGKKRRFECKSRCSNVEQGSAVDLLNIVSMASGPNGSMYIGDFNLIRLVTPEGAIFTVLEFESAQRAFDYDLTLSPADNMLYLSHAKKHQIWRIKSLDKKEIRNPGTNWEPVVGTGDRCVPGDGCGDNGPASKAQLNYPKGLAISVDKTMYISDSRNIRVVTPEGIIQTLIGNQERQNGPPRPLPCQSTLMAGEVHLQWPTKLALNPLDSALHIVDDTMVLKVTPDMRIHVVAGMSPMCTLDRKFNQSGQTLGPIVDMDISHDGTLYFLEKTGARDNNQIHEMDRHGAVRPLETHCACSNCSWCTLRSISSLMVAPDGKIHVSDNEALKILTLEHLAPQRNPESGEVQVTDPMAGEVYTFNRFSQHVSTISLETGTKLYTFVYTKNTALGRLSDVIDGIGNSVSLKRDYSGKVQSIDTSLGQKLPVVLTSLGLLNAIELDDGELFIDYDGNGGGLLTSVRHANGDFGLYDYDTHGRAISTTSTSGIHVALKVTLKCHNMHVSSNPATCLDIFMKGELSHRIQVHQSGLVVLQSEEGKKTFSII
jgi:YD repeat-containing protein